MWGRGGATRKRGGNRKRIGRPGLGKEGLEAGGRRMSEDTGSGDARRESKNHEDGGRRRRKAKVTARTSRAGGRQSRRVRQLGRPKF